MLFFSQPFGEVPERAGIKGSAGRNAGFGGAFRFFIVTFGILETLCGSGGGG
jgi:hypothetical protein